MRLSLGVFNDTCEFVGKEVFLIVEGLDSGCGRGYGGFGDVYGFRVCFFCFKFMIFSIFVGSLSLG